MLNFVHSLSIALIKPSRFKELWVADSFLGDQKPLTIPAKNTVFLKSS